MENTISRREFLSRTVANTNAADTTKAEDDPFKRIANTALPFSNARTTSGLNLYAENLTESDLLHLLRRTTFGVTKQGVDLLKNKTLTQAVDLLIDNPQLPASFPVNVYQPIYPDTQGCPF